MRLVFVLGGSVLIRVPGLPMSARPRVGFSGPGSVRGSSLWISWTGWSDSLMGVTVSARRTQDGSGGRVWLTALLTPLQVGGCPVCDVSTGSAHSFECSPAGRHVLIGVWRDPR